MAKSEKACIRAIVGKPDDDKPRLMYADWLDAHDQAPRARLIRLQCEIAGKTLEATELFHQHGLEWTVPLRALGASRVEFQRGMPEKITVPIRSFLPNHAAINALTPSATCRSASPAMKRSAHWRN